MRRCTCCVLCNVRVYVVFEGMLHECIVMLHVIGHHHVRLYYNGWLVVVFAILQQFSLLCRVDIFQAT